MRAWAGLWNWPKVRFEDELRIARSNDAPGHAVYRQGLDWVTLEDIANPLMRSHLTKIARCDVLPHIGPPC